jgi:hypothetical protein
MDQINSGGQVKAKHELIRRIEAKVKAAFDRVWGD